MVPAPLLVLTAAICTQTGQAFGKQLSGEIGAGGVVALRLGFAATLLLVWFRPKLPERRHLPWILGLGTAIAGMNLVYPAMRYLPVGVASTLQLLGPLVLGLCTSRRLADLGAAVVAGAGVWLLNDPAGGALPWQGVVLALLSAVAMGAYLVLSRKVALLTGGPSGLAWGVAFAAVLGIPTGLPAEPLDWAPGVLLAGAAVATCTAVLPYTLEQSALRRISAGTVGVLLSLEPAVAAVAGLLVLDEQLSALRWLGLGCVSLVAAWTATSRRARAPAPPPANA
ncbi:EamA family transporter [Saccharothrix sp. AJ9571]|nr:EamA family transporter [Saccharothrix sp. AJ9571]